MRSPWLQDLLFLLYPRLCPACGGGLPAPGSPLCLRCDLALSPTGQHRLPENAFTERFWGRLPIEAGAAMFPFVKGGRVQRLVHAFKYERRTDVGRWLGARFGDRLAASPGFARVDCVVPVPLHPRRERQRGFNQSAVWGRALASRMGLPFHAGALRRTGYRGSQTAKSRMERLENVQRAFVVARPDRLCHRRVLLVDDVLTTGATLEACGRAVLALPGVRLYLATLAMARN